MKRLFSIFVVLCFIVGMAVPAMAGDVVKLKKGAPIHIAYWFVTSGPNTQLGLDTVRGIELAMEKFGGSIMGHPIKLSGQDTGCGPEGGQAAAAKIASDPTIVAAIGSNCSSAAKPGVPILWKMGIPTVSPSNTAPFLTAPGRGSGYDGYLRTCHNDKVQGAIAAEFAYKKLGIKTAATIHDGSVYADQLQQVFVDNFKKLGGKITSQEAVNPGDTDMKPVLTKIATKKPGFLYYPCFIAEAAHITRQSKEVGGLEKTVLMSADGSFSPDFLKSAGTAAVGMYHSSPDFSVFADEYQNFLKKHKAKYGEPPVAPFHGHSYDATLLVLNAIKKVAKKGSKGSLSIDRKKLTKAMLKTKNLKGLTGNITCDKMGDCADPHIAVYQVKKQNVKKAEMPTKPTWKKY